MQRRRSPNLGGVAKKPELVDVDRGGVFDELVGEFFAFRAQG